MRSEPFGAAPSAWFARLAAFVRPSVWSALDRDAVTLLSLSRRHGFVERAADQRMFEPKRLDLGLVQKPDSERDVQHGRHLTPVDVDED